MKIFTIGFAGKSASGFFEQMREHGIELLVDVRINNKSQLAGFAKQADLEFFLRELAGARYRHEVRLAPTREMLKAYRGKDMTWEEYERRFLDLMAERKVEDDIPLEWFEEPTVLLCSESSPERCHRRLVVEYLSEAWGDIQAVHL